MRYIFGVPADGIKVTPSLESQHQSEALIPATGGSLSATGSDGTTYRLDIPAGALASETRVRMTPVSKLEGMPFGTDSHAVQLEPEGLAFYDVAVLTITPTQEVPIDEQIFFGYLGEGEDLTLAPPVVSSREIQIQILHFSGYGVTKGLLADIEPVRARIGGNAERRLWSAIGEQLARARQEQLLGVTDGTDVDWEGFLQQYAEQVIQPRVAAAGESCAAGRLAIQTVLGIERMRQLLGSGESSLDSALISNGLMDSVAESCMKEEYELCRDDHIIHRIVPAWLGLAKQFQLLGGAAEGVTSPVLQHAKDYVRRCLSFELQFHSEGQGYFDDGGDGAVFTSVVDSKVKILFNPDDLTWRGQAPLVNSTFEFRVPDCNVTSIRGGDTFEAMSLVYISDTKTPTDALGYVRDMNLVYYPGNTKESFKISCPPGGSYTSQPTPLWTSIYLLTHKGEMSQADDSFIAADWEILGNTYYAKKEWTTEYAAENMVEIGTLKLYHRPG